MFEAEIVNYPRVVPAMTEIILREDLPHLDFSQDATGEKLPLVTPVEVLHEDFELPLGLSGRAIAPSRPKPP